MIPMLSHISQHLLSCETNTIILVVPAREQGKVTVLKFSSETQRNEWLEAIARLKGSGVAPAQCPPDITPQTAPEPEVVAPVATVTELSPSVLPAPLERLAEKEEGEEEEEEEDDEDEEEEEMEVETSAVHTTADAAASRSSSNDIDDDFDDDMEI